MATPSRMAAAIDARVGVVPAYWLSDYDRMDPARLFDTARTLRFG